jgi:hypothetical protein
MVSMAVSVVVATVASPGEVMVQGFDPLGEGGEVSTEGLVGGWDWVEVDEEEGYR